jgi:hypothetical protein
MVTVIKKSFNNYQNERPNTIKLKALLNDLLKNTIKVNVLKGSFCCFHSFKMKDYLYIPDLYVFFIALNLLLKKKVLIIAPRSVKGKDKKNHE